MAENQGRSAFAEYLEDMKADAVSRQQACGKFRAQCEKEAAELLSDPRQALIQSIEQFLRQLVNPSAAGSEGGSALPLGNLSSAQQESLQLACCGLVEQFLVQRSRLLQVSLLEELVFQLVQDRKKTVYNAAASCLQLLSSEGRLQPFWQKAGEMLHNGGLRGNGVSVLLQLCKHDQQASSQITNQIIQDSWTAVLEQRDNAVDCVVQILRIRGGGAAFPLILAALQTGGASQVTGAFSVLKAVFQTSAGQAGSGSQGNLSTLDKQQLGSQSKQNLSADKKAGASPLEALIRDNYQQLLTQILSGLKLKDLTLQREAALLLPEFARFDRDKFKPFQMAAFDYLLERTEKLNLLETIGDTAAAVGAEDVGQYFPKIVNALLDSLNPQGKKKPGEFTTEAAGCIRRLASVSPERFGSFVEQILEAVFTQGLTQELLQFLDLIQGAFSPWMHQLEDRLMQLIGNEIAGVNYQVCESLLCLGIQQQQQKMINYTAHQPKTQLALECLGIFSFASYDLTQVCADHVAKYIGAPNVEVRRLAAAAIIKHLKPSANFVVVNNVLAQVLIIGVTDIEPKVRIGITAMLAAEEKFDEFLAQKENLDVLFIAVNDLEFQVRASVVSIIGRLSKIHPVIVLPHIREILLGMLFELGYSELADAKEENVRVLYTIILYCTDLIQPFIRQVCQQILLIAEKTVKNSQLMDTCLEALAELFLQAGRELLEFLPRVLRLVSQALKENVSILKLSGLAALEKIVQGTALPVIPYFLQSDLLELILNLIKGDLDRQVQVTAAKTLVTVGALDYTVLKKIQPMTLEQVILFSRQDSEVDFEQNRVQKQILAIQCSDIESHGRVSIDPVTGAVIDKNEIIKIEKQDTIQPKAQGIDYVVVVLELLTQILEEPHEEALYGETAVVFRKIIYFLQGKQVFRSTNQLIEVTLNLLFDKLERSTNASIQHHYLTQLTYTISALNPSIRSYIDRVFQLAYQFWDQPALTQQVFALIEEVTLKFPGYDFIQNNAQIVQKLLKYYTQQSQARADAQTVIRSFNTVVVLLPSLKTQVRILLEQLLRLVQTQWKTQQELSFAALDCVGRICCYIPVIDLQSMLIQTLFGLMRDTARAVLPQLQLIYQAQQTQGVLTHYKVNPIGYKAFEVLHYVAAQLGPAFCPYVATANYILVEHNYQSLVFNALITLCVRGITKPRRILLAAVQSWREYVSTKVNSPLFARYLGIPIRVLPEFTADVTAQSSTEAVLNQIMQHPDTIQFSQIEPSAPGEIGVEALPALEIRISSDTMPKRDWVCDDLEDADQWREWLVKLQSSLIRFSPVEVIRYCASLGEMSQRVAREVFNYAYYSFSSDINLTTDMRSIVVQTLRNSLSSKTIPKDIVQQMLDLVEFLEHAGENMVQQLYDIKLGNIAEACYAYARCLRYREQEYLTAPQATTDILVRINKRLSSPESSQGIIFTELQRMNQAAVTLLFEVAAKDCGRLVDEAAASYKSDQQNPAGLPCNAATSYIKANAQNMLKQELRGIGGVYNKNYKQIQNGTTAIFVEGRPVFAGLRSGIMQVDYQEVAGYLYSILQQIICKKLPHFTPEMARVVAEEFIGQLIFALKDPMLTAFGARPQWFENINWHSKALSGYNEQLLALEQTIPDMDGARLREGLKAQQQMVFQKISCLYHLGCYEQVLEETRRYQEFVEMTMHTDKEKAAQTLMKFNLVVAKYCVQSAIELQNQQNAVQLWLPHLDAGMSGQKLLIQSIHFIQTGQLEKAQNLVKELMEQIMSPIIAGTLESYERAYDNIIVLQQAIELKEVIDYKFQAGFQSGKPNVSMQFYSQQMPTQQLLPPNAIAQRVQLMSIWTRRLANVFPDIDTWIGILRVRQLVVQKQEQIQTYLAFAQKCMTSGRQYLARHTLEELLDQHPENNLQFITHKHSKYVEANTQNVQQAIPEIQSSRSEVIYVYCQYLYQDGSPADKVAGFVHLLRLAQTLQSSEVRNADLLKKVYMQLADWYVDMSSAVQKETSMLLINSQTSDHSTEFRSIESSAVDGLFSGLESILAQAQQEQMNTQKICQDEQSTSEFTRNSDARGLSADNVEQLVGKIAIELVMRQGNMGITGGTPATLTAGILTAKVALQWFESAEKEASGDVQVQRCIAHATGFIVDALQDLENAQAVATLNQVQHSTGTPTDDVKAALKQQRLIYLKKALLSHFKCMQSTQVQLPAALRLLTLWFQYGYDDEVEDEFIKGLALLDIDVWLEVVPQLIARSTCQNKRIKYLIQQLLIQIGLKHPQLLVFPLMVATKRDQVNQQSEALSILDQIRRVHRDEIDQIMMVGSELARIAITWPEACMDGLYSAIIAYNQDKNSYKMLNSIAVLIQQFEQDPETPSEQQFKCQYYDQFYQGWEALKRGVLNADLSSVEQAKQQYFDLYNKLKNEVTKQFTIDLTQTSPKLAALRGSLVQIPGSNGMITISRFIQRLNIIASKQRPRKIGLVGSDSEVYAYLLKGREDLRQDERVMQLLGLINQLLQQQQFAQQSTINQRHSLHITRYPCVPIGKNTGLLFWVPNSDTINDLIKNYRIQKNFQDNSEDKQLVQRTSQYANLSLLQKLDAFKFIQQFCPGLDLKQVIWEQALNSENWLQRRTQFTTSLAVMSMTGYILGLGDRHPANIMVNRHTGQILHIDYGDCFEACQRRLKLPEKVPFRLTRMLVNAMEVSGIAGIYQKTAEITLRVLRNNKDSILSILQTFIYDPLIGWKTLSGSGVLDGVFEEAAPQQQTQQANQKPQDYDEDGVAHISPVDVVRRIEAKLTGKDFEGYGTLGIEAQAQALLQQAQSPENLCQHYYGWCPLW